MNQKRPEKNETYRDVCVKENGEKRRRRLYACLMNCAAPLLTAFFLAGSVCWASELQYGSKSEFDCNPEIGKAVSVNSMLAEAVVPLSNPVGEVTENTGAELVEACGVYVENEFVGAVVSGEQIEEKLELVLDEYKEDENIIEADYAVETEIVEGVYRSSALVSSEDMADYLTGEKEVVTEYTADDGDTPEKLADDFDMTVSEIEELNPDIQEIKEGETVKVKVDVAVLPVKYTCEETEEEELEYEVIMKESGEYFSGEEAVIETGEAGKKISRYEVTYIDGTEVSRHLRASETIIEPVDEIVAVGTAERVLQSESIPETDASGNMFIWPVDGGYISDPFISDRGHKGLDIAADGGTAIYASDCGTVTEAGWNNGGYGYLVKIDHGNGYETLYAHASEVYVSAGQSVSAGDVIAAVGTTGDSTGNHCHFEVRYNGNYLNPADFVCE